MQLLPLNQERSQRLHACAGFEDSKDFIRVFLEEYFAAMGVKAEINENLTKLRVTIKSSSSKV